MYGKTINVLDHGYVKYVDHMGDDLSPLEAARMSTGNPTGVDPEKDDRLRRRLWDDKHTTPFEMPDLIVEIQAPIFVARQVFRHRTASYNEHSGRYAEMPDLFYVPERLRLQSATNKQGSDGLLDFDASRNLLHQYLVSLRYARSTYEAMIEAGVSREMARMVLPVAQYTRWRQKMNLRNWAHFLSLRLPDDVQLETRLYAQAINEIIKDLWPKTSEVMNLD